MPASYYPRLPITHYLRRKPWPASAEKRPAATSIKQTSSPIVDQKNVPVASRKGEFTIDQSNDLLPPIRRLTMTEDKVKDIRKPLQLLDLPLEIQQTILQKCYESTWTVRATRFVSDIHEAIFRDDSPTIFALLLVSRHVHNEAKRAIEESRTGTYRTNFRYIDIAPKFFDNAITTFVTNQQGFVTPGSIKALRKRFPNLRVLRNSWIGGVMVRTKEMIEAQSLLGILKGNGRSPPPRPHAGFWGGVDEQILHRAEPEFGERVMDAKDVEDVRGIIISWSIEVGAFGMGVPWDTESYFRDVKLVIEFEVDEDGCRVCKRWLKDEFGREMDLTAAMPLLAYDTVPEGFVSLSETISAYGHIE